VLRDGIDSPKEHLPFGTIGRVDFERRKALLLGFAEELTRHFHLVIFQVVKLLDVRYGQLLWRDEGNIEDDISGPEATDVQSFNFSQNNRGAFSGHRPHKQTSTFIRRKPKTIEETIVQIGEACHASIFLYETADWREIPITLKMTGLTLWEQP